MILVGVKDNSDQDDKDRGVQGPSPGLGEEVDYGNRVAWEVGAFMYLECDLVSQEGLEAVFLNVSRLTRQISGSHAPHR